MSEIMRALVCCKDGYGVVLAYREDEPYFSAEGTKDTHDLGLGHAPAGITIWEGKLDTEEGFTASERIVLRGEFRCLTRDEWLRLTVTGDPFPATVDGAFKKVCPGDSVRVRFSQQRAEVHTVYRINQYALILTNGWMFDRESGLGHSSVLELLEKEPRW